MATKREKIQLKNGTKKPAREHKVGDSLSLPKAELKLQANIPGKGWTDITAPTTRSILSRVKRRQGLEYREVSVA